MVPTVTFRLLFVLVILAHDRRQIVHVAVTAHPTAAWTAQQCRNAFLENEAPHYLLHDRDSVFCARRNHPRRDEHPGSTNGAAIAVAGAYVERVIGSIRRECLDHVVVLNAAGLHRVLTNYIAHYMRSRTHLALGKGHTDHARGRTAVGRAHCRHSRSRRSAPSLRSVAA